MGKHLRLVVSNEIKPVKKDSLFSSIISVSNKLKCMFISRNEKIFVLKDILTDLYRDYEITTGIIDEPYFIKAEKKIRRIIREKKVDYYYNLLRKLKKLN